MVHVRPFRFGITTSSAGSRRGRVEKARTIEALGYATLTVPDHFPDRLAATPAQFADDLRQRHEEYGISYIVINTGVEAHIEAFAPVVALLAGR